MVAIGKHSRDCIGASPSRVYVICRPLITQYCNSYIQDAIELDMDWQTQYSIRA